jgi:putative tricarboxylic transport membrane protein
MGKIDIVYGSLIACISLVFYLATIEFPSSSIGIDPRVFPRIIIGATFALSILLLVQGIFKIRKTRNIEKAGSSLPRGKTAVKLIILVAASLVYALVFEMVGFVLATPVLIAVVMTLFGERKPIRILLVAGITSIVLYLVFRGLFRVPLPRSFIW